jgi:hypothetical protein
MFAIQREKMKFRRDGNCIFNFISRILIDTSNDSNVRRLGASSMSFGVS